MCQSDSEGLNISMMTNRTQHRVLRSYKLDSDVSKKALSHEGAGGEGDMFLNIWSQSTSLAFVTAVTLTW